MVETKGISATKENYEKAIPYVAEKYGNGVANAKDVIKKSIDAEKLYAAQMQKSIAEKRRAEGLKKITDEDWKNAAISKGKARIGGGMAASLPKYEDKMGKVLNTIESTVIPERTADIGQNVMNRCGGMAKALNKAKLEGKFR